MENSKDDDDENDSTEKRSLPAVTPQQKQYFRPSGSCKEAQALLEREDLTEQDILDFCHGRPLRSLDLDESEKMKQALLEAYHKRRTEISDLARKLWTGEAVVDDDGRLVPAGGEGEGGGQEGNHNNNNGNNHRPLPNLPNNANNNNNNNNNNAGMFNWNPNPNNNNNMNPQQPFPMDPDEEERRWLEREERDAAEAIARAVQRYRKAGVPEEEFVLLKVPPAERSERANLTFRRICFAVLAVVTAFICIMLQTLPLFPRDSNPYPRFDKLLHEILVVRFLEHHLQACPNLGRTPMPPRGLWQWAKSRVPTSWSTSAGGASNLVDCSDGVLHIPSKTVVVDSYFESATDEAASVWEPYVLGINASWFMPCHPPTNATIPLSCQSQNPREQQQSIPDESCDAQEEGGGEQQHERNHDDHCFRGVHDDVISDHEVGETLRIGADLIQKGGDHFDIHYDTSLLETRLPTVLDKIRRLLRDTYSVPGSLVPVAFRVNAVAPMDGTGAHFHGTHSHASDYLVRILNKTNYIQWIEDCKHHNDLARYPIPWPSRAKRDPCQLMSDLQADPSFAIHTTVFLSTGAGRDFRGGVSLYVDDHKSNKNPRRKIRRGLTIDGSRGRLVVSTGGLENQRCRLPVREGIRAALQIWWGEQQ